MNNFQYDTQGKEIPGGGKGKEPCYIVIADYPGNIFGLNDPIPMKWDESHKEWKYEDCSRTYLASYFDQHPDLFVNIHADHPDPVLQFIKRFVLEMSKFNYKRFRGSDAAGFEFFVAHNEAFVQAFLNDIVSSDDFRIMDRLGASSRRQLWEQCLMDRQTIKELKKEIASLKLSNKS